MNMLSTRRSRNRNSNRRRIGGLGVDAQSLYMLSNVTVVLARGDGVVLGEGSGLGISGVI